MAAANTAGPTGDRILNVDMQDATQSVYQRIDVGDELHTFRGQG